nr:maturase K [Horsfieldia prainii]UJX86492.1 maturase K [Horsfieldia prainii]UJX86658.1 maturase K [Horsfieldia prainii]UJX86824.1 maturase K [Horsfieldia prainii]
MENGRITTIFRNR